MIKYDRLNAILTLLEKNGSVKVTDLSLMLGVTEETIRKDLDTLENEKKLKRVRGGAFMPNIKDKEVPVPLRESMYMEEKEVMAKLTIDLIEDSDSIALDSSTTCLAIANQLLDTQLKITVITNSLDIFNCLKGNPRIDLIGIGGNFRRVSHSFVGANAQSDIARYLIDKSFISSSGLSLGIGPTDNSEVESLVRKQFMIQSKQTILVVDHTKFDFRTIHLISDFSKIQTVITDQQPINDEWLSFFEEANIRLIY
ncbi:DeoR/GlpR family DNA-binding transcription regulator [Vagococcus carniphilus]|uniref:DeoR/GlpR family DNA-binding transcription regulator n=1 Tax=Vagococcus carniphilus TaxID=218144 RepID=A0AAW8U3J3_9ENTE|nr:DeoR/GlpR family DNA-binding transcription regulator [Vagococcus carniphilus]MDT2832882.1 DeoR/GlpR family DNA-binding transcription regulator [Vagococcus carniphilus]